MAVTIKLTVNGKPEVLHADDPSMGLQRVNRIRLYAALGGSFDAAPATTVQLAD